MIADKVEGDIVEMGVWRGGGSMYAKALVDAYGEGARRRVHLFDVFDTDTNFAKKYAQHSVFGGMAFNSVEEISKAFAKFGLLDEQVRFHAGLFNTTTRAFRDELLASSRSIAVLRIDGNFYASYEDAMYTLYELVPIGGIVIFDDLFDNTAIQLFWRHFQGDYNINENVTNAMGHGPGGCGWFRKTQRVTVDPSKMRRIVSGSGRR